MATAFDLISSALRLVGVLSSDESPNTNDANQGLSVLNDMIDSWNAQRLAIFTIRSDDFPLVLGQQTYTLGAGGNFNIPRPARIDGMSAILLDNPSNPVEVPIVMFSIDEWQNEVPVKVVNSTFPQICYDNGAFPLRTLNFWPIPAFTQNSVRIYSWAALTQPPALTSVVAFPPGYAEAFRYNLAVRLGAEFNAPASATVVTLAVSSMATVKTMNAPELGLKSDLIPDPAGYNYKADMFGIPF